MIIFARLLATLAVLLLICPAYAEDDDSNAIDDIPHITIIGTARTEVAPDVATITLGVTTERPTATAATAETAGKAKAIIDAAKAQGIAATDIVTQSLTLTQTFDDLRDPQGRQIAHKPRGFAAETVVAVKVHDLTKAGALAQTLIETGANRFEGIIFSVEHPEPILDRLTGEAVESALAQAQIAAEAAGVRLGRVLLIERPSETAPRFAGSVGAAASAAPAPSMPIEPGTTTLNREIEVTWALGSN